jgi:(S)-sulfolactate dehydrogenase
VWLQHAVTPLALDALLARADVVSLHVPLVDSTRNLIDAAHLALMRPDAVLINTSRGGIVDEAALARALKAGALGGAALDVFAAEPLAASSPLADAPNLLLTPHVAGVTAESNERVSSLIAQRVAESLQSPRR